MKYTVLPAPHHTHTLYICHQQLQAELDEALDSNKELSEHLQVAHVERREAMEISYQVREEEEGGKGG